MKQLTQLGWLGTMLLTLTLGACDERDRAPYADFSTDGSTRLEPSIPVDRGPTDASSTPDSSAPPRPDAARPDAMLRDEDASVTIDATMPLDAADIPEP